MADLSLVVPLIIGARTPLALSAFSLSISASFPRFFISSFTSSSMVSKLLFDLVYSEFALLVDDNNVNV